jgi:hypothetical protein
LDRLQKPLPGLVRPWAHYRGGAGDGGGGRSGSPVALESRLEVRILVDRIGEQQAFGVSRQHHRPDVLAEILSVGEIRTLAGGEEPVTFA